MVKVTICENTMGITSITVKGHAGYQISGKDIVCASVSSIVITSVNAIVRLEKGAITFEQREGFVSISVVNHSNIVDQLLNNMIELLIELEHDYKNYIKINKEVSSCNN